MIVATLGAGFGSDDLGETLINVHAKILLLCCLIMYDKWSVISDIVYSAGLGYM